MLVSLLRKAFVNVGSLWGHECSIKELLSEKKQLIAPVSNVTLVTKPCNAGFWRARGIAREKSCGAVIYCVSVSS